jgi:host factor-I protein
MPFSPLRRRPRFDTRIDGPGISCRAWGQFYFQSTGLKGRQSERSGAMAERSQNLQDLFLNTVRKQKISLTIFLINGVKLTGVVTSFDNFCVLLRRDGHSQLVYKHAISTIMPGQPLQMFETEESGS